LARDSARRRKRQSQAGRDERWWRRFRKLVLNRDSRACRRCGATTDLTVDLINPALRGDHRQATVADCITACRPCNSRGGRAEQPLSP